MISKNILRATIISTALLSSTSAMAQLGTIDPGRISEEIRNEQIVEAPPKKIELPSAPTVTAPAGAENIHLTLRSVEIEGNNVYDDSLLSSYFAPLIGQNVTLLDVYNAANEISKHYRGNGYVLTQVVVPPQTIDSGNITIRIVEGYIDEIIVESKTESGMALEMIADMADHIKEGGAININSLERYLLLINDLPGVSARSIISASPTKVGAADLTIIVDRAAVSGIVYADNYGSKYIGPWTFGAAVTANSPLDINDALTGQVVYSPGNKYELAYGGLNYDLPVNTYGTRVNLGGSITKTDPDIKLFDITGKSTLYTLGIMHPFIRSRSQTLYGRLFFDWRDVESHNNIERKREDNLRVLRAQANYIFSDTLFKAAYTDTTLTVSKGLDVFSASKKNDRDMSRTKADPQFTKAELTIKRLENLYGNLNFSIAAQGQLSADKLPSSEEFGVGGFYSGRGYDPSEIVGEHGVSTQLELQYNIPNNGADMYLTNSQFYGFYDIGKIWNDDATTSRDKELSIASAGFGARFSFTEDVQAGLGLAFPLTKKVTSEDNKDPRFYFNINKRF
jgi:hemolysin activation/secretion protein